MNQISQGPKVRRPTLKICYAMWLIYEKYSTSNPQSSGNGGCWMLMQTAKKVSCKEGFMHEHKAQVKVSVPIKKRIQMTLKVQPVLPFCAFFLCTSIFSFFHSPLIFVLALFLTVAPLTSSNPSYVICRPVFIPIPVYRGTKFCSRARPFCHLCARLALTKELDMFYSY